MASRSRMPNGLHPCYPRLRETAMRILKAWWLLGCAFLLVGVAYAYQAPFREYPSVEYGVERLPPDYQEKTEFAFARLMYPPGWNDGYRGRFDGDWRLRAFALDAGLSAGRPRLFTGRTATDAHSHALRRGVREPRRRRRGLQLAVPVRRAGGRMGIDRRADAEASRLSAARRIFHGRRFSRARSNGRCSRNESRRFSRTAPSSKFRTTIRSFTPCSIWTTATASPAPSTCAVGYKNDGNDAHWRGIYDDHGRVMVAISFNSDIGDSWEWSNDPRYPQKFSDLGMRIGVNYVDLRDDALK